MPRIPEIVGIPVVGLHDVGGTGRVYAVGGGVGRYGLGAGVIVEGRIAAPAPGRDADGPPGAVAGPTLGLFAVLLLLPGRGADVLLPLLGRLLFVGG